MVAVEYNGISIRKNCFIFNLILPTYYTTYLKLDISGIFPLHITKWFIDYCGNVFLQITLCK